MFRTHSLFNSEDPSFPRQDLLCRNPVELNHVLPTSQAGVKAVGASGGYGMLVGPHAPSPRAGLRPAMKADPTTHRSADHSFVDRTLPGGGSIEPRHVDLRPFLLAGSKITSSPAR